MKKIGKCKKCGKTGYVVKSANLCTDCYIKKSESRKEMMKVALAMIAVVAVVAVAYYLFISGYLENLGVFQMRPTDTGATSQEQVSTLSSGMATKVDSFSETLDSIDSLIN